VKPFTNFMKMKSIAVLVFPDADELDFVGVYEVLGNCNRLLEEGTVNLDRPLQVDIVARQSPIQCRNGLKVVPDKITSDFGLYDILIVPGGGGIRALMEDKNLLQDLKRFSQDHVVCSVCTGSLVLGAAGILEGKRALTHRWFLKELETYAKLGSGRVHLDENVMTSVGISSSIDLGLKLVELLYDKATARKVAERMELPATYYPQ